MTRLLVVLVVALTLSLLVAQAASAVDLQAGWYVRINGVHIFTYGPDGPTLARGVYFYGTPVGQYGPFAVTDPFNGDFMRLVSVPANAYGVGPESSLIMPLVFNLPMGERIAYVEISWGTNYDANAMYLQMWRRRSTGLDTLVWDQRLSGVQGNAQLVARDTYYEGPYYLKLNVVPEPSGAACLAATFGCLLHVLKRRRA